MITKEQIEKSVLEPDFQKYYSELPSEAQTFIVRTMAANDWGFKDARSGMMIYLAWLFRLTTDIPQNMQQIFNDGVLTIKTEAAKIKSDEAKEFAVMVDKLVAEWQGRIDVVTRKQISANAATQTIFSDFAKMLKDRETAIDQTLSTRGADLVAAANNFKETMIKVQQDATDLMKSEMKESNKQTCDLVKEQLRNDERDHLRSINFDLETSYRLAASTSAELTKAREKLSNITTEAAVIGLKHAEAYYKKAQLFLIGGLIGGLALGVAIGLYVATQSFNASLESVQWKLGPAAVVSKK